MYYLLMKTLSKPQAKPTIASSSHQSYQIDKEILTESHTIFKFDFKMIFLILSILIFFIAPESPETSSSICHKHYSKQACSTF